MGKQRKENARFDENGVVIPKEKSKRGYGTDKTPVVCVKERGTNRVYAQVALPNEKKQKLMGRQLMDIFYKVCQEGTLVASDDFKGYCILNKETEDKYVYVKVNDSIEQFSAGNVIHTNNIENFWSLVKRQFIGGKPMKYKGIICFVYQKEKEEIIQSLKIIFVLFSPKILMIPRKLNPNNIILSFL